MYQVHDIPRVLIDDIVSHLGSQFARIILCARYQCQ